MAGDPMEGDDIPAAAETSAPSNAIPAAAFDVAPPPPSPQLTPAPSSPIPPPGRAALRAGQFAEVLPLAFETPKRRSSPKELSSSPAVAEGHDNAEVLYLGDEMSPELMNRIITFADYMKTSRSLQGVFTFLLLALVFRVRVFMWYNMQ